jgi:hypothetical protein
MSHFKDIAIDKLNKKYQVKFINVLTKEEHYCERPFNSYQSALFFTQAIDATSGRFRSVIEEVV